MPLSDYSATAPPSGSAQDGKPIRRRALTALAVVLSLFAVWLIWKSNADPFAVPLAVGAAALLVAIVYRLEFGIYALLASVMIFEQFQIFGIPDPITGNVPLYENFSNLTALKIPLLHPVWFALLAAAIGAGCLARPAFRWIEPRVPRARWIAAAAGVAAAAAIALVLIVPSLRYRLMGWAGLMNAKPTLNPVELLIFLMLVSWFVRAAISPDWSLRRTPNLWITVLFAGVLALFTLLGLARGGDLKAALWEVRALFYLIAMYVLAVQFIRRPSQVRICIWIVILGVTFKGLQGCYRYFVTLGGSLGGAPAITSHEDAVFMSTMFVLVAALFLTGAWKRKEFAVLAAGFAPTFLTFVLTQRRIAGCV